MYVIEYVGTWLNMQNVWPSFMDVMGSGEGMKESYFQTSHHSWSSILVRDMYKSQVLLQGIYMNNGIACL